MHVAAPVRTLARSRTVTMAFTITAILTICTHGQTQPDPSGPRTCVSTLLTDDANVGGMAIEGIKNVTAAIRSNGFWNNSLIIFSADNGGIGQCERAHTYPPLP